MFCYVASLILATFIVVSLAGSICNNKFAQFFSKHFVGMIIVDVEFPLAAALFFFAVFRISLTSRIKTVLSLSISTSLIDDRTHLLSKKGGRYVITYCNFSPILLFKY